MSINAFLRGVRNSYSQVFFSDNAGFAVILIFVSFFDPNAGLAGLISIIISNFTAYKLGFNRIEIEKGLYGFNSLLVGLGMGYFFKASFELYIVVVIASLLTLFFVTMFKGILQKYALPYLSIPFLFGIWIVLLAADNLDSLGISQKGIFNLNTLYGLGGNRLINLYEYFRNIYIEPSLKIYFTSIAAIFFQFSVLAGILLSVGLLIFSRIAFVLSLYGFYTAFFFYKILGGDIMVLSYSYIGFNYILTAIAIGGFYIIPSKKSFLWLLILIPVVSLITLSFSEIFAVFGLSVYSLPFNIVMLLFIYSLKFRIYPSSDLNEAVIQYNSPEKNFYAFYNQKKNPSRQNRISFSLPFHGPWTVSQAFDGEHTHQGEWRHAWDFIIRENEKEFNDDGNYPTDYFCYGKSVLSPAHGTVVDMIDDIPDNDIGKINLLNNWGNTLVIKHDEYLYTGFSHLKPGSIKVKTGDTVKTGQKIAETGNSGRSPYPHLHFQFQANPYIGSKTIDYPFGHYIRNHEEGIEFCSFVNPGLDDKISNVDLNYLLKEKFGFIPGQILNVKYIRNGAKHESRWEVFTTLYNQSYIYDYENKSFAWFVNDGHLLYFTQFTGNKSSLLYYFYLGFYKILFSWYNGLILQDEIPVNKIFNFPLLTLQDFFAPFVVFLKSEYQLKYCSSDNELQPKKFSFHSELRQKIFVKTISIHTFDISVSHEVIHFKMKGDSEIEAEIS